MSYAGKNNHNFCTLVCIQKTKDFLWLFRIICWNEHFRVKELLGNLIFRSFVLPFIWIKEWLQGDLSRRKKLFDNKIIEMLALYRSFTSVYVETSWESLLDFCWQYWFNGVANEWKSLYIKFNFFKIQATATFTETEGTWIWDDKERKHLIPVKRAVLVWKCRIKFYDIRFMNDFCSLVALP